MAKHKFLTKSRFKTAYECPRKLYYNERAEYGSTLRESDFMKALAEGGFQIGALAKRYFPGGVDLEDLHGDAAIQKTKELLVRDEVTIYEAAIQVDDFLVRVDILRKKGSQIDLIEVKAKSYDFEKPFFSKIRGDETCPKRGSTLSSAWEPYLVDVAFQTFVARRALPSLKITPYLCLVDKRVELPHEGLHQCFLIKKENDRPKVIVRDPIEQALLIPKILSLVNVSKETTFLIEEEVFSNPEPVNFTDYSIFLGRLLSSCGRGPVRASELCKGCEFRISKTLESKGLKNGFKECWTEAGFLQEGTRDFPTILDLWDNRRSKKHLDENIVFLNDVPDESLGENKEADSGLSRIERQLLQIQKIRDADTSPYFDRDHLERFFSKLVYPLHFIDFETTRVAIPFHKNQRPYEQIAYQFSHHVMHKDGRIEHRDQYLHMKPGEFPNFEFVQSLSKALSRDSGTVFRYSHHENTTLNDISRQLQLFRPEGFEGLTEFLETITQHGKEGDDGFRKGERTMIDLCELVKRAYYSPKMGGSNSIKVVTPSILSESELLQKKYSAEIYGRGCEIPSLNFGPTTWVRLGKTGEVLDPYKTLPPLEVDDGYRLTDIEQINEGGGASVAWARMQFSEMSENERRAIGDGLLRYCELDTLSMVWLLEYFRDVLLSG